MYAVAGDYLGEADQLPIIRAVGEVMSWVAVAVWATVFVAMGFHLRNTLLRPSSAA